MTPTAVIHFLSVTDQDVMVGPIGELFQAHFPTIRCPACTYNAWLNRIVRTPARSPETHAHLLSDAALSEHSKIECRFWLEVVAEVELL